MAEEDRSALFNQLKNFSQRKLKKVETKVVTASGEQLVEKRGAKGLQVLENQEEEPVRKLDLQVGLILPGLLLGSQDVAHDKSSLESYGITHILSLDSEIENKFEDDFNYKNVNMQDRPDYDLNKVLEDCFDFIDDGRHYGNVFIHCSGTIGLSRSTTICIAYLMSKENQKFDEAFNNVKEVRSFVKPNEGFVKQLKEYEVKLRGAQEVKESGIDDPFALRKKQEIEQEKAMVAGAASVKNRMKMFGATLDTNAASRSKSVSPSPFKSPQPASPAVSKWSSNRDATADSNNKTPSSSISKSMTPEPRKTWQTTPNAKDQTAASAKPDWRSSAASKQQPGGPPPPPPPMPSESMNSSSNRSSFPPPPPPPPPAAKTPSSQSSYSTDRGKTSESQQEINNKQRSVFGKVPPPPMKISGGSSVERRDSTSDRNMGFTNKTSIQPKASLQLPLKRQSTLDKSGGNKENQTDNPRGPSPSAALRAAKQQVASKQSGQTETVSSGSGRRPSAAGQLNKSSTKKLLNLIKTKTKSDLTLPDGDENDEIEALLGALGNESVEDIDWDELGLDEDEVKDIIRRGADEAEEDEEEEEEEESSSSGSEESDEEEEEEEEVETSTQHFVIRTK